MSLILTWCLVTSFKKVKSKTTLSSIRLLSEVLANATEVFSSSCRPRFLAPSCLPGTNCFTIHAAISLLTKEAWAPESKSVIVHRDVCIITVTFPALASRSRTPLNFTLRDEVLWPSTSGVLFLAPYTGPGILSCHRQQSYERTWHHVAALVTLLYPTKPLVEQVATLAPVIRSDSLKLSLRSLLFWSLFEKGMKNLLGAFVS